MKTKELLDRLYAMGFHFKIYGKTKNDNLILERSVEDDLFLQVYKINRKQHIILSTVFGVRRDIPSCKQGLLELYREAVKEKLGL